MTIVHRVQLKKLLDDCGVPKLSFEQTAHRSKTVAPVDSNETKQNVMSSQFNYVICKPSPFESS